MIDRCADKINKMNKKGAVSTILQEEILYFILLGVFIVGMAIYLNGLRNNANLWEEVYAKEIVRIVDHSAPGTEIKLDVTSAVKTALKNGKKTNEIFIFDNVNKKVIVSLRSGGGTGFYYLTNVSVIDWHTERISGGIDKDQLIFKIA